MTRPTLLFVTVLVAACSYNSKTVVHGGFLEFPEMPGFDYEMPDFENPFEGLDDYIKQFTGQIGDAFNSVKGILDKAKGHVEQIAGETLKKLQGEFKKFNVTDFREVEGLLNTLIIDGENMAKISLQALQNKLDLRTCGFDEGVRVIQSATTRFSTGVVNTVKSANIEALSVDKFVSKLNDLDKLGQSFISFSPTAFYNFANHANSLNVENVCATDKCQTECKALFEGGKSCFTGLKNAAESAFLAGKEEIENTDFNAKWMQLMSSAQQSFAQLSKLSVCELIKLNVQKAQGLIQKAQKIQRDLQQQACMGKCKATVSTDLQNFQTCILKSYNATQRAATLLPIQSFVKNAFSAVQSSHCLVLNGSQWTTYVPKIWRKFTIEISETIPDDIKKTLEKAFGITASSVSLTTSKKSNGKTEVAVTAECTSLDCMSVDPAQDVQSATITSNEGGTNEQISSMTTAEQVDRNINVASGAFHVTTSIGSIAFLMLVFLAK